MLERRQTDNKTITISSEAYLIMWKNCGKKYFF